jgi:type IV secretion system protein VirB10
MAAGLGLPDKKKLKMIFFGLGVILFFVFVSSLISAKKEKKSGDVQSQIDKERSSLENERVDDKEIEQVVAKQIKEAESIEKKRQEEETNAELRKQEEAALIAKRVDEEVSKKLARENASSDRVRPPSLSGANQVERVMPGKGSNKALSPEEQEEARYSQMMNSPIFGKSGVSGDLLSSADKLNGAGNASIERKLEDLERKFETKTAQYDNLVMTMGSAGSAGSVGVGGVPAVPQDPHDAWEKSQPNNQSKVIPTQVYKIDNPKTLIEGSIIPVVLNGRINTDLPGTVTAVVTTDIYDSITGDNLVIPKGSKVNFKYNSAVGGGQVRVGLLATRISMPNGTYVRLPNSIGADNTGESGLTDEVDTHFWSLLGSGLLVSMLSVGVANESKGNSGGDLLVTDMYGNQGSRAYTSAAGQILVETAKMAMKPYNMMKPTIVINQAMSFNVIVNNDISF